MTEPNKENTRYFYYIYILISRAMLGRDEVFVLWSGLLYKTNTKRENGELGDRWNLYRPKPLVHITPSVVIL